MPEVNSKRVQNKTRQKKAKQDAQRAKKKTKSQTSLSNANISWESQEQKKEEKTSTTTLYLILAGLFLLFLFVLWALVEDRPTLLAKEKAREKAEARRNATYQSNIPRKTFGYESSVLFNSTQLTDILRQLAEPESELERIVMIAFDDSTGEAAQGDVSKVKLFRKMEAVAKSIPRKKMFQRYEDEELPLIGLFDCGNPNDQFAEKVCKDIIQSKIPNVVIFRKMNKPRILPQELRSDNQITAYLHSLMQPPVVFLDERTECEDFVTDDKYLNVILFGTDDTSVYEAVADNLRDFARFGKTKNPSNAEAFFTQIPSILAWRTFGENPVSFAGNISDAQSIQTFVLNQYLPPLGEFNERTQHQYIKRGLPIVWIAYEQGDDTTENLLTIAEELAGRYLGAVSFVKLEVHEQPKVAENLGIKIKEIKEGEEEEEHTEKPDEFTELPHVLIVNQLANLKQPIDTDNIEQSITVVINEYFQKLRASQGDVQTEMEEMEENDYEEAEDDDSEDTDETDETEEGEENVDLDSESPKEDL